MTTHHMQQASLQMKEQNCFGQSVPFLALVMVDEPLIDHFLMVVENYFTPYSLKQFRTCF